MKNSIVFFGGMLACFGVLFVFSIFLQESDSGIPPTNAFSYIFSGSSNVTADSYNSNVTLTAGNNMAIQINHENNTIIFGSSISSLPLEGLSNVTIDGCTSGQVRQVNSSGWWVCADAGGSGEANTGANVGTGTGNVFRDKSGVTLNFKTLKEGSNISITDNADDITISASGSTGPKVYNQTVQNDQFLQGLNNVTGEWTTKIFSIDNQTILNDFQVVGINNVTGTITTNQFSVNTQTCSGTDKISSIDNVTGAVICSTDQSGSGGGSGIPKPTQTSPKKWGQVIPISATLDLLGLLQSATLDGTETYTYNTVRNTGVISSACGTTAGGNCGVVVTATNRDSFRRDQNSYLYADVSMSAITGQRMFIGFRSGTTALPNNADTIVNALSAFGVCIRTTDTLYQRCENDGSGAGTYTSLGVTEDTNWHTFEVYADATNNQWCVKVDGGTASCATSDIPAATTRMWVNVEGETSDTTSENFIYSNIYVENDQ
jgi:hypothetical protein